MVKGAFRGLEKDEVERMHEAALQMLQQVGVQVKSPRALALLSDSGAIVDHRSNIVKIPGGLVKDAIKNCPKEFVLGSRDGLHDLKIPASQVPWMCTDGFAVEILDPDTWERRMSTDADLARFARMADALDTVDFFWPSVNPNDCPRALQMLRGLITSMENTGKHIQYQAIGSELAKLQIRAACIVAKGERNLAEKPTLSSVQCTVSPLQFEKESIEAAMEFAQAGIPVVHMSMPMMGATAPITLAGAIVLGHAEVLGGLTISQLSKKGAPVFQCILSGLIDMSSGAWASGSSESAIGDVGAAQLAKYAGIPSMEGGFGTSAKMPGIQCGYEKMATMLPSAMAGNDILTGLGGLDGAKCMSMAQAIIDSEMWSYIGHMIRGVEVSTDSLSLGVIREIGPGGCFLKHRQTLEKFRSELWIPTLATRHTGSRPIGESSDEIVEKAKKIALDLSSHPPKNPLPEDLQKELEGLLRSEMLQLGRA